MAGLQSKRQGRFSKVRTMPSSSMGCTQSCLVIAIALAIVLIAAGCFGLWAVADYILLNCSDSPILPPSRIHIPSCVDRNSCCNKHAYPSLRFG